MGIKRWYALAFMAIILLAGPASSEELTYRDDIKAARFNDVWKRQVPAGFRINYSPEKDAFYIYMEQSLHIYGFELTRSQADSLIASLDKYKEWNIKASEQKVTLEKEIQTVPNESAYWRVGKGDWYFTSDAKVKLIFFSQNPTYHQLVLSFPSVRSSSNEYVKYSPDTMYMDYAEAIKLRDALKPENVSMFLAKQKKQAEIEAQFN